MKLHIINTLSKPLLVLILLFLSNNGVTHDCDLFNDSSFPARQELERLKEEVNDLFGDKWRDLNIENSKEAYEINQKKGHEVAFLVEDGRYKGGEKFVRGYIYDIEIKSTGMISVTKYLESLSPAAEKRFFQQHRGKIFSGESMMIRNELTFVISLTAPEYKMDVSQSTAVYESVGWRRKPKDLVRIKANNIIEAKVFY